MLGMQAYISVAEEAETYSSIAVVVFSVLLLFIFYFSQLHTNALVRA